MHIVIIINLNLFYMQISFFEDSLCKHFKPLTLTRPVWDLRIGVLTILKKWKKNLKPDLIHWQCDDHIQQVFTPPEIPKKSYRYYINSRFLPSKLLLDSIKNMSEGESLFYEDTLVAQYSNTNLDLDPKNRTVLPYKPIFIEYFWDMLQLNGSEISSDIALFKIASKSKGAIDDTIITGKDNMYISDSATIEPGVILMADKGPIFIGDDATIEAGAIIKGPAAVCRGATVKMTSRIYDSTTIGPVCKIGGEVSRSIFHSYTNKAHDGFVGNSILGQWCNMGADSNTSNLKNNYGFVRIQDWETREPYRVGFQFFGTVMGDHSKTSINCMLSTGTTCGVSSNIFNAGFPPKYIPSFTWMDGDKNPEFRFKKALEVMKAMMARRHVEVTPEYEKMMRYLYDCRTD